MASSRLSDKPQNIPKYARKCYAQAHTFIYSYKDKDPVEQTHTGTVGQDKEAKSFCFLRRNSPFPWTLLGAMRAYQHAADFRCYFGGACLAPRWMPPAPVPAPAPATATPTPQKARKPPPPKQQPTIIYVMLLL